MCVQGCTLGKHSNEKPEPVQPETTVKESGQGKTANESSNVSTCTCISLDKPCTSALLSSKYYDTVLKVSIKRVTICCGVGHRLQQRRIREEKSTATA